MTKKLIYALLSLILIGSIYTLFKVQSPYLQGTQYIRAFDLGGGGLKTALLRYDPLIKKMNFIEPQVQLGKCPDDMEVHEWIRLRMNQVTGKDLDAEIQSGYLFGFSLGGLNKLRSKPLPTGDMSVLFQLPSNKIRCIDDGDSHLVATLNTLKSKLPKGPIWNFAIGTNIGLGFTFSDHRIRNMSAFWLFFGCAPWSIKESRSGLELCQACSSTAFDKLLSENSGIPNDGVFLEFASRWKSFIETSILEPSKAFPDKRWAAPAAIVFTGGHINAYDERLVDNLRKLNLNVSLFTGPKNAGILGAAWNVVTNGVGRTPLIEAIANQNIEKVKQLLSRKADVNKRDALGNTPLAAAIEMRNIQLVDLLIKNKAEVNVCDFAGQSPLSLAVRLNIPNIVAFLLNKGALVNFKDNWKQTPMFFAAQNKEIEKLLLLHGAEQPPR